MKHPELSLVLFVVISLAAVDCGTFPVSRMRWCLAELFPMSSQRSLHHLLNFLTDFSEYCVQYAEFKNATFADDILCKFATKATQDYGSLEIHRLPAKPLFAYQKSPTEEPTAPVYLNVYDLEKMHPVYQFFKCVYWHYMRRPLYQSSISFRGTEYYFGPRGLSMWHDGRTSFGEPNPRLLLTYENMTVAEFEQMLPTSANGIEFVAKNYRFLEFDSNAWTNETLLILYGQPIPSYIDQANLVAKDTQMTRSFSRFVQRYLLHDKGRPN